VSDKRFASSGDVRRLAVFRRAYALSLEIHVASRSFPRDEQYRGVADQLRRATKSVCALLVEGRGRQVGSDVEFRRYVIMAIGSADEAALWCEYARDLGYVEARQAEAWISELSEIARMLQGILRHLSDP
jgi:four helix bundle protein